MLTTAQALQMLAEYTNGTPQDRARIRAMVMDEIKNDFRREGMLDVPDVQALERGFDASRWASPTGGAAPDFSSASREFTHPVDLVALAAALAAPDARLLRAKGVLTGLEGRRHLLQGVGRRIEVRPLQAGEPAPVGDRLLLIGLGDVDRLLPRPA